MLDKNVDVCLGCHHISSDAWLLTDSVVKQKLKNTTLTCQMCFHDLHTRGYLCDSCLIFRRAARIATLTTQEAWAKLHTLSASKGISVLYTGVSSLACRPHTALT